MTYSPDRGEGGTNLLVNFGGGLKVAVADRIRIRMDVKDHVDLCDASGVGDACFDRDDDEALHNIELSGGVEFRLGR